jgi:molybdate transport system regulatory protein
MVAKGYQFKIRIMSGETIAFGPGKASLLEMIGRTGSISAGAREMGMSYRRAWLLVDEMNRSFREPLVQTAAGGPGGGGAKVTDFGRDVLRRYREMEDRAAKSVVGEMKALVGLMISAASK